MNAAQLINQTSGIYAIVNTTNQWRYIGSAVNLKRRKKEHFVSLRAGAHHCQHLQRSWNKHGADKFIFEIIEEISPAELLSREQCFLDAFADTIYNTCRTAYSHLGVKRSPEIISRMKQAFATRKRPPPFSDEHRKNISKANRGRHISLETREKLRVANSGKRPHPNAIKASREARLGKPGTPHTEETKRRIAASHIGIRPSESTREKMRMAKLGRKYSAETRAKMSKAATGRVFSNETKLKMSAAALLREAAKRVAV